MVPMGFLKHLRNVTPFPCCGDAPPPCLIEACSIKTIFKVYFVFKTCLCQNVNSLHRNCSVKGIMCGF